MLFNIFLKNLNFISEKIPLNNYENMVEGFIWSCDWDYSNIETFQCTSTLIRYICFVSTYGH